MLKTQYDIVIIGAGPSGLATAIATALKLNLTILVIDQNSVDQQRVGENIPPETLLLIQQLGLKDQFLLDGHEPCPGFASVWGGENVGHNDFIVNPYGHSWRLNRHAFDMSLVTKAKSLSVDILWDTRFISANKVMRNNQVSYDLSLKTPAKETYSVQAFFVVDASGSKANFAKGQKVKKRVDDKLIAIVRFATLNQAHKGKQVRIEATANNWCYHTLLPQQKVVSMLIAEPSDRKALENKAYHAFKTHLEGTDWVGRQIRELELRDESYHTYLITSGMLEQVEGDNWIAVGDAAASFDPIVAQGIYKGLQHGILAAKVIISTFKQEETDFAYSDIVEKGYRHYLDNRAHIYQLEQRWPTNRFWQKRARIPHELTDLIS